MAPIDIRPISSKEEWEAFAAGFAPHTFLQSWQWGEFNNRLGTETFTLGVFEEGALRGICLALLVKARRATYIIVPHGPIIDWGNRTHAEAILRYLSDAGRRAGASFIRWCPAALKTDARLRLFRDLGFRVSPIHTHPEIAWMLDIRPGEEDILRVMRKQTRYSIRKAERDGITVEHASELGAVQTFYDLYASTAARHQFTPFSFDYLRAEFETFARDNQALLFFARQNKEVVAAAMVIFAYGSAFYHHGASVQREQASTAPHLLQWEVIREAKRRGARFYNFWGIASSDKPKHPWAGLTFFKKSFGGFAEEYVPSQDYILGMRYWPSFIFEYLRKAKRGF